MNNKILTLYFITAAFQLINQLNCAEIGGWDFWSPRHPWHRDLVNNALSIAQEVEASNKKKEDLWKAMNEGKVQEVQNFLSSNKYYLLEGDSNNFSPLMRAVYLENVDLIKAILPLYGDYVGVHINCWRSKDGKTTLHIAKNIKDPKKMGIILELLGYKEAPMPSSASSECKTAKEEKTSKINVKAKPFTPQTKK